MATLGRERQSVMHPVLAVSIGAALVLTASVAFGEEPPQCADGACSITYRSEFFSRYAPVTALDMVQNLPGFEIDDGDGTRGFAGAAGNILINGERVSAKSETPSDLLSRIPAADVEQIVVIRGQGGGLDLRGQAVVANIIRRSDQNSGTWFLALRNNQPGRRVFPRSEGTYALNLGALKLTSGIVAVRYRALSTQDERVTDTNGALTETRDELFDETGYFALGTLNAALTLDNTRGALNVRAQTFDEEGGETSLRTPTSGDAFQLFQGDTDTEDEIEVGLDLEHDLSDALTIKLIGLFRRADYIETGSLVRGDIGVTGVIESETRSRTIDSEIIARLEIDYSGWTGHLIELSVEGALNELDSEFSLNALEGGILVPQDVPGAETIVSEERIDISVSDSFQVGEVNVDLVVAAEASNLEQTGGFAGDRSFFFWKPNLTLSYGLSPTTQLRLRGLRQVGQLNFFDFVSAADLGDVELALGNPELAPERTDTVDLTIEKRTGKVGTLSVTAFYDRIRDVQDVLPLQGMLEVPGNIGSGWRSGASTELTLPLDDVGLSNGRLDMSGRWQYSRVRDPLSGERRELSGEDERELSFDATIRQDIQSAKLAWSLRAFYRSEYPLFGLDELDVLGQRWDLDGFIETRVIPGVRVRLTVEDWLRINSPRDRQVFAGSRTSAPLSFRERRDSAPSRQITLEARGVF